MSATPVKKNPAGSTPAVYCGDAFASAAGPNATVCDYTKAKPTVIEAAQRRPSQRELAKGIIAAARFVPRKTDPRLQEFLRSVPAPSGNSLFRPRSPSAPAAGDVPAFATLTPDELRPLSTPAVAVSDKDEVFVADGYQETIRRSCRKVVLEGPDGDIIAYRPKGPESRELKAALAALGFVPLPVESGHQPTASRVYVQQDIVEKAFATMRGSHTTIVVSETGKRRRVGTSPEGRVREFNQLHPEGERFGPDGERLFRLLEQVAKVASPIEREHRKPPRRPGETVAAPAPRAERAVDEAEAREQLRAILAEHSDAGSFFSAGSGQIEYYVPKDDTARTILNFFGYRKTSLSYPHLKEGVYVLPQHLAAARKTLVDQVRLLAKTIALPWGGEAFASSDKEVVKILGILGYQRTLHDTNGDGYDEAVMMTAADAARARTSDIPGTRLLIVERPDGSTFKAYRITHPDGIDGVEARFSRFAQIDIGSEMYFAPDDPEAREALAAAKMKKPTSDKAFGK